MRHLPFSLCSLAIVAGAATAAPEPATQYVVQPGDTCLEIAIEVLGDRALYGELHRLNPHLGPMPHVLVPGTVLTLPPRAISGPDARLTRAHGDVKIRRPSNIVWDIAERGMDLFRAWRIGAAERATAELTFRDDSRIAMRERTIVVIYGPERRLAKVITAAAELEQGTLEARLGELDGKPVIVRTPSAETDLRAGEVVVSTAPGGTSIVANHRGAPVAVRGRTKRPGQVRVRAGMGSRVLPGKPPEPPRPLPATPAWDPPATAWIALGAQAVTAPFTWTAIHGAATYRLALRDARGDTIAASLVAAPARTTELALAPGTYTATVAAIDADGFESAPSEALAVEVLAASLRPAGAERAVEDVPSSFTIGDVIVAPAGSTCRIADDPATERIVLSTAGTLHLSCATQEGRFTAPRAIQVVLGAAAETRAHRPEAVVDHLQPSTPLPPVVRAPWELGVFAGYQHLALGADADLGDPARSIDALDDGFVTGLRAGWAGRRLGVEAELGLARLDHAGVPGAATILSPRLSATVRHDDGPVTVLALAGVGVQALLSSSPATQPDTDLVVGWGGGVAYRHRALTYRVEVRHDVLAGDGGLAHGLQARLGLSIALGR